MICQTDRGPLKQTDTTCRLASQSSTTRAGAVRCLFDWDKGQDPLPTRTVLLDGEGRSVSLLSAPWDRNTSKTVKKLKVRCARR